MPLDGNLAVCTNLHAGIVSFLSSYFKGDLLVLLSNPIVRVPLFRLVGCTPVSMCDVIAEFIKMRDENPGPVRFTKI